MTFIVGLTCTDGIVLCTDSLEDDGITKKTVDKIRLMGTTEWGLALAGSGPGSTIEKFFVALGTRLPRAGLFDRGLIEAEIEDELANFSSKYVQTVDDQFHVIVASYNHPTGHRLIYKGSCFVGQSVVLSPVMGECRIGMANELWRLMSDALYEKRNSVDDNVRLAIFATRLAIEYASGVDEPVQVVSYTFGDQFWRGYSPSEIGTIESELPLRGFKDAIRRYWRINNPPTHSDQLRKYKGIRTPGDELTLLDGVKLEEISTIAGRQRASKIFRRNTDKLQQRALLEAKRYREAHPSASPPSDDKSRT
jgi:hypothetical protein